MEESFSSKKESDGQLALYRLLRLQNRQNNFYFHDNHHGQDRFRKLNFPDGTFRVHFKVSYQHFPLQTIDHNDLLKTFWKFITTHYFKKIDQEEILRLNYLRTVFQKYQRSNIDPPAIFNHLTNKFKAFWSYLQQILSPSLLASLSNKVKLTFQDILWLKRMYIQWCSLQQPKQKKTKKIAKINRFNLPKQSVLRNKKLNKKQLKAEEEQLDNIINQIQSQIEVQDQTQTQMDNIDDEIQRLQNVLESQSQENITLINHIQAKIIEQEEEQSIHQDYMKSGQDARCLEWLIHNLQEKQIAESVSKIVSCQKKEGQIKFLIQYESALNLMPGYLKETALKKINQLRQTSLLKFYRTGVKSLHSYISHNFSGFLDLCNNRMALSKSKDKDYIQIMKKHNSLPYDLKQQFCHYDICHHCKFIYPPYMLSTCRFRSDKQTMPKISEAQTDFGAGISLQKSRVSQRFVTKHRNCMTGYAWINEEYVCGRKFCFSCLKDNYGRDWMKLNNGICPFCEGICSCTRCMRNEKMNKLKAFFISLGGDINNLQSNGLIQKLAVRKEQVYSKIKTKNMNLYPQIQVRPKVKKIRRVNPKKKSVLVRPQLKTSQRWKNRDGDRSNTMIQEETERWSSTAEKQLQNTLLNRRLSSRRKKNQVF